MKRGVHVCSSLVGAGTLLDLFQINVLQSFSGLLESILGVASSRAERRGRDPFHFFEGTVEGGHGLEACFFGHDFQRLGRGLPQQRLGPVTRSCARYCLNEVWLLSLSNCDSRVCGMPSRMGEPGQGQAGVQVQALVWRHQGGQGLQLCGGFGFGNASILVGLDGAWPERRRR